MKYGRPPFCFLVEVKKKDKIKIKASFNIECVPIRLTILPVARNKQLSKFDTKIFGENHLI